MWRVVPQQAPGLGSAIIFAGAPTRLRDVRVSIVDHSGPAMRANSSSWGAMREARRSHRQLYGSPRSSTWLRLGVGLGLGSVWVRVGLANPNLNPSQRLLYCFPRSSTCVETKAGVAGPARPKQLVGREELRAGRSRRARGSPRLWGAERSLRSASWPKAELTHFRHSFSTCWPYSRAARPPPLL